jgi:2-polyprenyl-3-methyl-5-hydroxy-6-metoxy-1,4-benzoquinol methylase
MMTGDNLMCAKANKPNRCRFCESPLQVTFVDLGMSPLCESFLSAEQLNQMEPFFPLHVWVCEKCFLVQLEEYVNVENIFTDYAYFSSYSDSWLKHAENYTNQMMSRFGLNSASLAIELASNDGYLLQYFVKNGIPVLGIEPAANVAEVATKKGVSTLVQFFGRELALDLAARGQMADLLLGNNVLAQVPDLNNFVAGMKILLKPRGVITMEFPHLMRLMQDNQFDTIYHEHFSYFSLWTVEKIFAAHGIALFDVEELPTHGGSLRIYGRHAEDLTKPATERLEHLRAVERAAGVTSLDSYAGFSERVKAAKRSLLDFLICARRENKKVAAYGAPGKGNTLLNYCGIRTDFIDFTVDRNPHKHGKFLPGTHIPIFEPEHIREARPDYLVILPWNLRDEIIQQNAYIRSWGGRFVLPIPRAQVID